MASELPRGFNIWAKVYFTLMVVQHISVGIVCVAYPNGFKSEAWEPVKSVIPIRVWGYVYIGLGLMAAYSLIKQAIPFTRFVTALSSTATGMWAVGFFVAALRSEATVGPIVWGIFAIKDVCVSGMPLHEPVILGLPKLHGDKTKAA